MVERVSVLAIAERNRVVCRFVLVQQRIEVRSAHRHRRVTVQKHHLDIPEPVFREEHHRRFELRHGPLCSEARFDRGQPREREIRRAAGIQVIFLTAKGDIASKIKGLKDGAEDYIVKPFEMLEVMVRLEKVLERKGTVQEQIQIGDVIIDTSSRTVTKMGMEIYLKPMEYNCLMVFAKNPNKALTRNQILQELWNEEFCGETRTVDAHVGRIRKKLGWQDKIKTIPRIGYRLEVDL